MQELMNTYNNNIDDIENFLVETLFNLGNIEYSKEENFKKVFKIFPSLELIYYCNKETMTQVSENIYRHKTVSTTVGRDRNYLLKKINLDDSNISISKPYISSATGESCITVAKIENDKVYLFDFNLSILLRRLGLIEINQSFNLINKSFYFITSIIMMILAIFTIAYASYEFIHSLFFTVSLSIESIFKPVIALTLGLAIFDLAKTVLAQEVIFKSYSKNSSQEYKLLIKFSITIIIALLIESLMVVFKIAIDDYSKMIHAFYLIGGVSTLMLMLGFFIYLTKKK